MQTDEFSSEYLDAIQSVEGHTPGEKYRTLNLIARRIAETHNVDDPIRIFPTDELPIPLIPWVTLEVADLVKRPQEIANALLSEDRQVFNRALKIKWYFTGNIPNYSDVDFFVNKLFPKICLIHRLKIVRLLGQCLRPNPDLAEIFYPPIAAQYGYDLARPILLACNENFLWDQILELRLVLNFGELKYLYNKFPGLVLDYLKKSVRDGRNGWPNYDLYIDKYNNFSPLLVKKHPLEFIEFIETSCHMGIQLSGEQTKIMLKAGIDSIIKDPILFLPMLNVKNVWQVLKLPHYKLIMKKLISNNIADLDFDELKGYLKYIPDKHKTSLIISTIIEKHGSDWMDKFKKISPAALRQLPTENRIALARKKLLSDTNWHTTSGENIANSWRCYLPIKESIPAIKAEIAASEDVATKLTLMRQMILTCEINNDSKTLLSTLTYICTHYTYSTVEYTKDQEWELMDILLSPVLKDSPSLKQEHWKIITDYIQFLKKRQGIIRNESSVKVVLIQGIEFDIINKNSIKAKIDMLTDMYQQKLWILDWNILDDNPRHERLCLKKFSKSIPKVFAKHRQDNTCQWREICLTFLKAIYDYNYRHYTKEKKIRRKLSIKQFPWLLESIEKLLKPRNGGGIGMEDGDAVDLAELDDLLRCNEPDALPPESLAAYNKQVKRFQWTRLRFLFNSTPGICDYEKYYEECRNSVRTKGTRTFLRYCRWHNGIPRELITRAIEDFTGENRFYDSIIVFGILVEGSEFERYMTPRLPDPNKITSDLLLKATVRSLNYVNPVVSLDFMRRICDIGIDHIIVKCLLVIRARIGANRVIPFCRGLSHRNVNLFRHSIDTLRIVAKLDEILPILGEAWEESKQGFDEDDIDDKNKRHQLIRSMLSVFETKPCIESWHMVDKWLNDLNTKDDPATLVILTMYEYVPNNWVGKYLEKMITTIRRLEEAAGTRGHWARWFEFAPYLEDFPYEAALLIPDNVHEFIISVYWNITHTNRELMILTIDFFINAYIFTAEDDDLEDRLDWFSRIFAHTLLVYRDVKEPTNQLWDSTIDTFLEDFAEMVIFYTDSGDTKNRLIEEALNSYLTVMAPHEHPQFYCYFYFSTFYDQDTTSVQFIDRIHNILPILFGYFSAEHLDNIAGYLHRYMRYLYGNEVSDMIIRLLQKLDRVANCLAACLYLCDRTNMSERRFWQVFCYLRASRDAFVISRAVRALEMHNREMLLP